MSPNCSYKTSVLTSRENYVWTSMQEIIPSLEEVWKNASSHNHLVEIIHVEDHSLKEILPRLIDSDNVVFTCFTFRIAQVGFLLRSKFGIDARYIIHLHNMATIACWPLRKWNLSSVLTTNDRFVSTCTRDLKCMDLSYTNHETKLVPFTLLDLDHQEQVSTSCHSNLIELFYVGRISAQKNIHTLIFSLYLLKKKVADLKFKLTLFGGEDNLGSPNMEQYRSGYKSYLENLVVKLSLQDHVEFAGFVDRKVLYKDHLAKKHILISPSIHSDENFGIAALRALAMGNIAVLSDWGGHTDFGTHFSHSTCLVPVEKSNAGPYINPFKLADTLNSSISRFNSSKTLKLPSYYKNESVSNKLQSIAFEEESTRRPLIPTVLSDKILNNQAYYMDCNEQEYDEKSDYRRGCKVFESYEDDLCSPLFESYGMITSNNEGPGPYIAPPWVTFANDTIIADDFHRGAKTYTRESGEHHVLDFLGNEHSISKKLLLTLLQDAQLFSYSHSD